MGMFAAASYFAAVERHRSETAVSFQHKTTFMHAGDTQPVQMALWVLKAETWSQASQHWG